MGTTYTTFVKTGPDGQERTRNAYTPEDAVRLRYEGWTEKRDPLPEPVVMADGSMTGPAEPKQAKPVPAEPEPAKAKTSK